MRSSTRHCPGSKGLPPLSALFAEGEWQPAEEDLARVDVEAAESGEAFARCHDPGHDADLLDNLAPLGAERREPRHAGRDPGRPPHGQRRVQSAAQGRRPCRQARSRDRARRGGRTEGDERADDRDGGDAGRGDPQLVDAVVERLDLACQLIEPVRQPEALAGRLTDLGDQVDGGLSPQPGGTH